MTPRLMTRRTLLQSTTVLAGGVAIGHAFPGSLVERLLAGSLQQTAAPPSDALTATRAQMAAAPIETVKLGTNLTMLSGPGGNVVVLHGNDGKIVVDTFVLPVWSALSKTIDGMGSAPREKRKSARHVRARPSRSIPS